MAFVLLTAVDLRRKQMQVVRRSLSLSIKIINDQVLCDKKKEEPAMFWSANSVPAPSPVIYINLKNFRLSKLEEREE